MKIIKLFLILFLASNSINGQSDSIISKIAKNNMIPFTLNQSFQGDGWDKIVSLANKHKYFLIGEDHGFSEIPKFTKALHDQIGYDLFVTEIDSVTASIANEVALGKTTEIDNFHKKNPSALSFYSAKEEFELLKHIAKSNADIWGLDQVSLFSTGVAFRRLKEVSNSDQAKKLASDLANLSDALFNHAVSTGNYDTIFIFSAQKEVFENLRSVFKNESQAARSILNDIDMSWQIYNNIDGANHFTRISKMKAKLLNYHVNSKLDNKRYEKSLYKFGAIHVGKAESPLGGFDVGNFVSNIADAEGTSAYHLMIVGKKGETNTFIPTTGMQTKKFDVEKKDSQLHSIMPFAEIVEDEWTFFDLNPIRRKHKKGEIEIQNPFLKAIIYGYDGLVIIPEVTPSTIIH